MPCIIYSFSYSGCKCRFNPNAAGLSFFTKLPRGLVRVTEGWLGKAKHPDSSVPPDPASQHGGCAVSPKANSSVRIFFSFSCSRLLTHYLLPLPSLPPLTKEADNWVVL